MKSNESTKTQTHIDYKENKTHGHKKSLAKRALGIITHDFTRKLIALFFATLIYFIVDFKIGEEVNMDNIIIKLNVPEKLSLMETPPTVTVRLKGSKGRLNAIMKSQIKVSADIHEENFSVDYPYNLKLSTSNVAVNIPGVSVIDITPKMIELNVETRISKKVPIMPRYTGLNKLADNLTVTNVSFAPSTVTISGAKSFIDLIENVSTKPIPLDNVNDSFEYKTKISPPDKRINISPKTVITKVEIGKKYSKRTFNNIHVKIIFDKVEDLKKLKKLVTLKADVRFSGPTANIANMQQDDFYIFIDASKIIKKQKTVILQCWTKDATVKSENIFPAQIDLEK